MTDINNEQPLAAKPINATKKERSAAYPAITIEQSLKLVADVYKNFRSDFARREDILKIVEGSRIRHLAASRYYQFLQREGDTYKVTDFYKSTSNPLTGKERIDNLRKSFISPTLYKKLVDKFDGDEIPKELTVHLSRFYDITEDASHQAAEVFIKNAKFVGALSEDNILRFQKANEVTSDEANKKSQELPDDTKKPDGDNLQYQKPSTTSDPAEGGGQQKLLQEIVNGEKIKIRLTQNRFAYLEYPINLSAKDVEILQKQIDQLKLIAEY